MRCCKCNHVIPRRDFDREEFHCAHCNHYFSRAEVRQMIGPNDCLLVWNGDMPRGDFDSDFCSDCYADCPAAGNLIDDFEYTQDEEGNWGYDNDED